MEMQNVKNKVTGVFTPARLKKAAALAVLAGVLTTGGAYYHTQQAEASSAMERQYKNERITAAAEQRGMTLIDTDRVQQLTAQEIGRDVSEIDFYKIKLSVKDGDRKHRDGKHERKNRSYDDAAFHPIYKVTCFVGDVKYKLRFDAETGDLLSSKVDYDSDDIYHY